MKNRFLALIIVLLCPFGVFSQDVVENEAEVKDIISFLEYMLNTLGDPATSARDKDVIVTESYSKIFRDADVQVEDDLDENRDVITNKDAQAYLKDVNFFFRNAHFDFEWQDMEVSENEEGETFYKVSLLRNLQGVTVMGDTVNQTIPRYVEINLNTEEQDLRIASIYTNELNQDDAWMEWWKNLSLEWQSIFKRYSGSFSDLNLKQIKELEAIEELDLQKNGFITDIEPLSRIRSLKRLNIAETQITDIAPIRNLNKLEELDISETGVTSVAPLKYARSLRVLHLDHSPVQTIDVISRMPALEVISANGTFITDFTPIGNAKALRAFEAAYTEFTEFSLLGSLPKLEILNLTATGLQSGEELNSLSSLTHLYADSTEILSLSAFSSLKNLKLLSVNHTSVSDLSSIGSLESLERIYCDNTGISFVQAREFMKKNPDVLVIFESADLADWWNQLPGEWKTLFKKYVPVGPEAAKEDLARIVQLDSLNISNSGGITNLDPLNRLMQLEYLNASGTTIQSVTPLQGMRDLRFVDISQTQVTDITPLADLINLQEINAAGIQISDLGLLRTLPNLRVLDIDGTQVSDTAVINMARMRPETLVLYKTERLEAWWSQLSENWQSLFQDQLSMQSNPDRNELHRLISLKKVDLTDQSVTDLHPLKEFIRMTELNIAGTGIRNLSPLTLLPSLEVLDISRNPLEEDISPLSTLVNLRELNLSNTPVDDLSAVGQLNKLVTIDCSGTQIKDLDGLGRLPVLSHVDCSNTSVKKLDPVENSSLKTLKCYNTRINSRRIEDFKQLNPECDVSFY